MTQSIPRYKDAVAEMGKDVDVVYYGDSITEGWKGTKYVIPREGKNLEVFNSLFTIVYKGIPMGISGATGGHCLMTLPTS